MRNNRRQKPYRLFVGAALALIALCGCDDSHSGKQSAKVTAHKSSQAIAAQSGAGAGWRSTTETSVSLWGFDRKADNAAPDSLAAIRAALDSNMLPPRDSVRIADLVNRLLPAMDRPQPGAIAPSSPSITLVTTPWNVDTLLLWIDISGLHTSDAASVSIAFNPDIIAAFRPLGDPGRLPILNDARSGGAVLYELMPLQGVTAQSGAMLAVLRVAEGVSGKSAPDKKEWTIPAADLKDNLDDAPQIVRFAAAVAGFGSLLRGDPAVRDLSCSDVIALAQSADRPDPDGRRAEIIRLMQRAEPLIELPPGDASATQDSGR